MDLFDELDAVWLVGSCAMKNSTTTFFPRILTQFLMIITHRIT